MEPIAIIGMACRFPGAKNSEAFWKLLRDGRDVITTVPPERWESRAFYDPAPATPGKMNSRWGGFLEQVDHFDAHFFEISPREAMFMDPQQRLLLEVAWEALEHAGLAPAQLANSQTGVFIGISNYDYNRLLCQDDAYMHAYSSTGTMLAVAANRLSYVFNLRGPSLAVETACSSSLVAVHLAYQSLQSKESNLALAGGVNLMLSPQVSIILSQTRILAADGRCKTFDADANGYVRSEGCGVVVLKRLSDAFRDGDPILALLRGSAVNQDGRSNGLTAPRGAAQQAVIRDALTRAGVEAAQVSHIEAHGIGTYLGDIIEVRALQAVLLEDRATDQPCAIGSVKTNIGHTEAASGIAGLIKVVLALQHEEIPAHLHLKKLNPHIRLEKTPFFIPTQRQPWPRGSEPRLAGVSAFGIGGTNAHVVLEEAPIPTLAAGSVERPLHPLTLSAKSESALQALARRYETFLADQPPVSPTDVCFTANTGRSHFAHRLVAVTDTTAHLRQELAAFSAGHKTHGLHCGHVQSRQSPKVAFLFTGQGTQYIGMGRQLYNTQPTFRKILAHCHERLRPYLDPPLLSVLYPEGAVTSLLDETAYTQPALFALEYALAELWRSWGIEPAVVVGHGVGEYVAACVAGVFNLEDGLKLVAERGRLMQALSRDGEMAVSHTFCSPVMEPILDAFEQTAAEVAYASPRIGWISSVTGQLVEGAVMAEPGYWCRQTREAVRFSVAVAALHEQGCKLFVELGPNPMLLEIGRRCLPEDVGVWLPSLRRGRDDWLQMLDSLGALYRHGVEVDWLGFDQDYPRRRVALPTYPFERNRFWLGTDGAETGSH